MRLSAPPAKRISQSPRSMRRKPSPMACVPATHAVVIVLFGPWAFRAIETWAATMFGRYLRIQSGNRALAPFWLSRSTCKRPSSLHDSTRVGMISGRSIGTMPVPMTTPMRSGFSLASSSPLSRSARPAAPTANRVGRFMIF